MVAVLPCGHSPGGSGGLPHGITENAFNVRGMVLRLLAEIGEKITLELLILVNLL